MVNIMIALHMALLCGGALFIGWGVSWQAGIGALMLALYVRLGDIQME